MDYFKLLLSDNIVKNIRGYNESNDFMINGKIKQRIIGGVERDANTITPEQYKTGEFSGIIII